MKKLAVIALEKHTILNLKKDMNDIFGGQVDIEFHYTNDHIFNENINADLILYTSPSCYYLTKDFLNNNGDVLIMKRTILKSGYEKLMELNNEKVMLVNNTLEMTMETIFQLRQLGINYMDFVPFYPGMDNPPDIDIAVTPDHENSVPGNVKRIINIGNRKLDISTIMDLVLRLDIDLEKIQDKIDAYASTIIPIRKNLKNILESNIELENFLEFMMRISNKAIIAVNSNGKLIKSNEIAEDMFDLYEKNEIDSKLLEILKIEEVMKTGTEKRELIITHNGKDIVADVFPVEYGSMRKGAICICEGFIDLEEKHKKIKKNLIDDSSARYFFDDIIHYSEKMKSLIYRSKKISRLESPVLILGKSGTGKEMFAQAIHNYSNRKDGPFLAINCSNLDSNLLESELFGYEKGAFTGAASQGHKGLFETAYGGTIFLDEIGEMPIKSQAKILRVLEENEIRRVGGNKAIFVDVRIIAATNKDLRELVSTRLFRDDLYYRLSAYEIKLPTLTDRKEDIGIIAKKFCNDIGYFKKMPGDIMEILENYDWPGNIRQLRNAVEYLITMSDNVVTIQNLPDEILEWYEKDMFVDKYVEEFDRLQRETNKDPNIKKLFSILIESYENKGNLGRRSIQNKIDDLDLFFTENEVRRILTMLKKMELVVVKKGRSGTRLTEKGYKLIKNL